MPCVIGEVTPLLCSPSVYDGMCAVDSGRSDQHADRSSVLACSPLCCVAVCMAWLASVTVVTELDETVLNGCSV